MSTYAPLSLLVHRDEKEKDLNSSHTASYFYSDFTWQGKLVCMFLCVAGIALYSIPVGALFDSFGAVIGLSDEDEEEQEEEIVLESIPSYS